MRLHARTCGKSDTNYFSALGFSEDSSPRRYSKKNSSKNNQLQNIARGRAMSQTVSRVHTADNPFRSQTKRSVILGGENDVTKKFSPSTSVPTCQHHSTNAPESFIHHSLIQHSFSQHRCRKTEQLTDSSSDTFSRNNNVY